MAFLDSANNLSDVANASTALVNLRFLSSQTGAVARSAQSKGMDSVSVKDFDAKGDGVTNDQPAIQSAINSLTANQGLFFPPGIYILEPPSTGLSWETSTTLTSCLRLPDLPVTLFGVAGQSILQKGTSTTSGLGGVGNAKNMIQTAYGGTAKIVVKDLHIQGRISGGSSGNLVDGLVINGSSNGYFDVTVDLTHRVPILMLDAANGNIVRSRLLSNSQRLQIGECLSIYGSSFNAIYIDKILNSGSNGVGMQDVIPDNRYYPDTAHGGPYMLRGAAKSIGNAVNVGIIDGTGIGDTGASHDDDYYGLNICYGSSYNSFIVGTIRNLRPVNTADGSTYVAAVRLLWDATSGTVAPDNNSIFIGQVENVGPTDNRYLCRFDTDANSPTNNHIVFGAAKNYGADFAAVPLAVNGNSVWANNRLIFGALAVGLSSQSSGQTLSNDGAFVRLYEQTGTRPIVQVSGTDTYLDNNTTHFRNAAGVGLAQLDATQFLVAGNITLSIAGNGLQVKEGINARMGTATLVAGSLIVSNASVSANTRIFLTCEAPGGTPGFLRISSRVASTSFTISSSSATDTSTVAWLMIEPA